MQNKRPEIELPEVPRLSLPAIERLRELNNSFLETARGLDRMMEGIRNWLQTDAAVIHDAIASMMKSWQPAIEVFGRYFAAKKPLKQRGILPHRSTPWALFDDESPADFPDVVLNYYEQHWDRAEAMFLSDIDDYLVSDEAKSAFVEAVHCHRHGLYRASVLTLLPAAEMEFRRAFEIAPGKNAASLEELRRAVMAAPVGVVLSHFAPIDLFTILDEHLYERVKTPEAVDRFSLDPIPNRHAAIHGLVHYKSRLNSLNALIIADYVFFLISQLSAHLEAKA